MSYQSCVVEKFKEVDNILRNFQCLDHEKMSIYKILAAILHLGNIEFHEIENRAEIITRSEVHIYSISKILCIPADELRNVFLHRTIEVKNSHIM